MRDGAAAEDAERWAACGCAPVAIATFATHPVGVAMDARDVYGTNGDGRVLPCPRAGSGAAPTVLATDGAIVVLAR